MKDREEFNKRAGAPDGLQWSCRRCRRASVRERRLGPAGRAYELHRDARRRARDKGLSCTITREWVAAKVRAGRCEATGLAFNLARAKHHKNHPYAPSLDRIDSKKGYTPENTRVVVWAFNNATAEYHDKVFERVAIAYLRQHGHTVKSPPVFESIER